MNLFSGGYLPLEQRCMVENLFWAICHKIRKHARQLEFMPEELEVLDSLLSDTYFCNFSLFQSIPDSWAIKQLFPIMPIHRLRERPTRHAVIGDITCDSDGKIDQFIDRRDVKHASFAPFRWAALLPRARLSWRLPGDPGRPAQPVRRYQRRSREPGRQRSGRAGARDQRRHSREVLDYVEFEPDSLTRQLRDSVEVAVREGRINYEQAGRFLKFYEEGLQGYTYLEEPDER